jgi:hypothetical protein
MLFWTANQTISQTLYLTRHSGETEGTSFLINVRIKHFSPRRRSSAQVTRNTAFRPLDYALQVASK